MIKKLLRFTSVHRARLKRTIIAVRSLPCVCSVVLIIGNSKSNQIAYSRRTGHVLWSAPSSPCAPCRACAASRLRILPGWWPRCAPSASRSRSPPLSQTRADQRRRTAPTGKKTQDRPINHSSVIKLKQLLYILIYRVADSSRPDTSHRTCEKTRRDYWVRSPKLPAANDSRRAYVHLGIRTLVLLKLSRAYSALGHHQRWWSPSAEYALLGFNSNTDQSTANKY